jgi:hypothetical protein
MTRKEILKNMQTVFYDIEAFVNDEKLRKECGEKEVEALLRMRLNEMVMIVEMLKVNK